MIGNPLQIAPESLVKVLRWGITFQGRNFFTTPSSGTRAERLHNLLVQLVLMNLHHSKDWIVISAHTFDAIPSR